METNNTSAEASLPEIHSKINFFKSKIFIASLVAIVILVSSVVGLTYYSVISFGKDSWINTYTQSFNFESSFLSPYVIDAKTLLASKSDKLPESEMKYIALSLETQEKINNVDYSVTFSKNFDDHIVNISLKNGEDTTLATFADDSKLLTMNVTDTIKSELEQYYKSKLVIPSHKFNNDIVDTKLGEIVADFKTSSINSNNVEFGSTSIHEFQNSKNITDFVGLAKILSELNLNKILADQNYSWDIGYSKRETVGNSSFVVIHKILNTDLKDVCTKESLNCEIENLENYKIYVSQTFKLNAGNTNDFKASTDFDISNSTIKFSLSKDKVVDNSLNPNYEITEAKAVEKKNALLAEYIDSKYEETKYFKYIIQNPPKYRLADYRGQELLRRILTCAGNSDWGAGGCTSPNDPKTSVYIYYLEETDQIFDSRELANVYLNNLKSGLVYQYSFTTPTPNGGYKYDPDLISYKIGVGVKFTIKPIENSSSVILTILDYNFLE